MPKYPKLYSQRGKDSILKTAECRPTFFVKRHSAIIVGLPKAYLAIVSIFTESFTSSTLSPTVL